MLNLETRLDPNEQEVAAQVIDGEAILINLSSGVYYSLDKASGLAWALIAGRYSLGEVAATLAERFNVPLPQVQADAQRLADELLRENLVRASAKTAPGQPLEAIEGLPTPGQNLPYETLQLNVYRDMGDLLALDPPMPGLEDIPWKPADSAN